jgi:glucose-1-phosphatase
MSGIKNIIFDFGGVLLNIDENLSINEFKKIFKPEIHFDRGWEHLPMVIDHFETGKWTKKEFFQFMKQFTRPGIDKQQITDAWCAMLLDFPASRMLVARELGQRFNTYLLSNTDPLHVHEFESEFLFRYGHPMKELFKKIYYSSEIGCRKPSCEPFKYVLADAGLNPSETLFIDDKQENCDTAASLGIKTLTVPKKSGIEAIMEQLESFL